jgi:uncharacterized membrane protein
VSLETGKTLGLISSLIFVIVPAIAISLLITFISSIISTIQLDGLNGTTPQLGGLALFGAGFGISMVILAVVAIIGLILLLIAMNSLANYYKAPGIFKNILYAFIISIVTVLVVVALDFALLVPVARNITTSTTATNPGSIFGGVFLGFIIVAVVAVVMLIISSVLVMRSFNLLGEKSEVDSFKTAGLLYLIGVLLSIVVIGGIIAWIGFIFAAIGFYRLKPLPPTSVPITYPPQVPPPTTIETKRCPYCQTENRIDATYCRFCGKPLT